MKIAAAYIRVSTDDQLEYSPTSQIKLINEYAKNNDLILPEDYIFIDEGISGRSTKNRTAFIKMMNAAKSKPKPFDVILVWKFSRFARNREDSIVYKSMLRKECNIDVISISEQLSDDKSSVLVEAIYEAMDEYYSLNLAEEVKRGMLEKVSRGEPVCNAPFGYVLQDKQYFPNPNQSPVIEDIFNSFVSGETLYSITNRLHDMGIKTIRGNVPDRRWVEYILRNPVYAGKIRWCVDGKFASKRDYKNPNIVVYEGKHQPIVSYEIFEKANQLLDDQKKRYPKHHRNDKPAEFMLKGLLRCGNCNSTLIHCGDGFQCHKYSTQKDCSISHYISNAKAEKIVIEALKEACNTLEFTVTVTQPHQTNNTDQLQNLLKKEEAKLEKIKDAYQCGVDTLDEYKSNKQKILETIDYLRTEINKADKPVAFSKKTYAKKIMNVVKMLESSTVSPCAKNEALRTIVNKIVYTKRNTPATLDIFFYI